MGGGGGWGGWGGGNGPTSYFLTWSQSYQTFYCVRQIFFPIFAIKLGRFIANTLCIYLSNTQASLRKLEKRRKSKDW
jgi:hypothetical protein